MITQRNVVFFLISNIVLGFLDQLQIFWQLYLLELLGLLAGLGYSSCSTWYIQVFQQDLVFFTALSLMEFQVRYLASFLLFSVIEGFRLLWMGNLHKNIQLIMLELLNASFLVLQFSYYTLMTFLRMLSVILLSLLVILLSILSLTRHLICCNN